MFLVQDVRLNKLLLQMFNGMQNATFASFKVQKDVASLSIKTSTAKKSDHVPTSFQQIKELKENNPPKYIHQNSNKKVLQNQQNTYSNLPLNEQSSNMRKNLIKVDKSNKKYSNYQIYKSPSQKIFQPIQSGVNERALQNNKYYLKVNGSKHQENFNVTPYICKTNRTLADCENSRNNSVFNSTQKTIQYSEKGSISISSKASFDSSIPNLSEDSLSIQDRQQNVNNSIELTEQSPNMQSLNNFNKPHIQSNAMKKSMQIQYSNEYYAPKLSQSVSSSVSSNMGSINFTQKFKHYRKQHHDIKCHRKLHMRQFIVIRQIGSGKYGKVFLVVHKISGFICAIKSVSKKIIKEQNLQTPFLREVKIQMYLNHPNIIKLYGLFQDVDNVYMVMEYCSGNHLFHLMRQKKQFQQNQIMQILGNIFQAVSFLHCNGIIHRDIKPENIVIENEVYKLCDFGWAAYACGDNRTTFCGTPLYVCPEVLKGQQYNSKVDIWGLGVIAYELIFGRVPFSITSSMDLMKIIKDPVYFPNWSTSSEKLIPFVKLMLSKNPHERPSLNEILSSQAFRQSNCAFKGPLRQELFKLL